MQKPFECLWDLNSDLPIPTFSKPYVPSIALLYPTLSDIVDIMNLSYLNIFFLSFQTVSSATI